MEKYFEVKKDSVFYKKYFDFRDMSNKVNELFKKFAEDNGIETKEYYLNTDRLAIVPTPGDMVKFIGMFMANSEASSSVAKRLVASASPIGYQSTSPL